MAARVNCIVCFCACRFFFGLLSRSYTFFSLCLSNIYIIFCENIHTNIKFILQIEFNGQNIKPTANCKFKREWMTIFNEKEAQKNNRRERKEMNTLFHIHIQNIVIVISFLFSLGENEKEKKNMDNIICHKENVHNLFQWNTEKFRVWIDLFLPVNFLIWIY